MLKTNLSKISGAKQGTQLTTARELFRKGGRGCNRCYFRPRRFCLMLPIAVVWLRLARLLEALSELSFEGASEVVGDADRMAGIPESTGYITIFLVWQKLTGPNLFARLTLGTILMDRFRLPS